ncbi:unnamed protein product [Microthlaspi erraticum]|uniref:PGG domain-containing protein n=1 Tax=Microthlaspi erraticum TaxID=1685480 RepID=A0A6D2L7R9_9BRAS|nr:unnamed protein product [Microthlaspi erraticum]
MDTTNVAAKLPIATIVRESPSLLRTWWMNKNLQYDVAMSSCIIIINIVAILHMRTHNIPFTSNDDLSVLMMMFVMFYISSGIGSCISWIVAIEHDEALEPALFIGRFCHTMGFGIFFILLYCISPHLALRFGVPGLIWFVAALVAPCCPSIWRCLCQTVQELRDWWKYVNQPRMVRNYEIVHAKNG